MTKKKEKTIQFEMRFEDQATLKYQNRNIELEVEYMFGHKIDYMFEKGYILTNKDKKLILESVRKDMRIPKGFLTLKEYDVAPFPYENRYQLHIFERKQ